MIRKIRFQLDGYPQRMLWGFAGLHNLTDGPPVESNSLSGSFIVRVVALIRFIRLTLLRVVARIAPPGWRFPLLRIPSGCGTGVVTKTGVSSIEGFSSDLGDDSNSKWLAKIEPGVGSSFGDALDAHYRLSEECSFRYIENKPPCAENAAFRVGWDKVGAPVFVEKGPVVSLTADIAYQTNYFHWLFDILPRIRLAQSAIKEPFKLYVYTALEFQRTTLAILGFDDRAIIPADKYPFVRAKPLIVPSFPNAFRGIPDWVVRYLCQELGGCVSLMRFQNEGKTARKLFVGRKGARHRRVENEAQVTSALCERGFKAVSPSTLSFVEQACQFRQAEVIVGVHGAALANLIFCKPGTMVLEIVPPNYAFPLYRNLCECLGLQYKAIAPAGMSDADFCYQKLDFSVDIEKLLAAVEEICSFHPTGPGTVSEQ